LQAENQEVLLDKALADNRPGERGVDLDCWFEHSVPYTLTATESDFFVPKSGNAAFPKSLKLKRFTQFFKFTIQQISNLTNTELVKDLI
jgi:hypothetical protein